MAGSTTLAGQTVDTGTATVTQGVATVAGTGITGYDTSDLPVVIPGDPNLPERKVSPDGVTVTSPNIGQVALSTTATQVRAATANRQLCSVRNLDASIFIYIGTSSGVTTSNGYLLRPYEALDVRSTTAIYAIAASGTPSCCFYEEVTA
jgi:hypothetical protein